MIDFGNPVHLIAFVVMAIGLFFDIVGCLGLVRLPDVYNRLQAGTKCVTLGTFLILLGVLIRFGFDAMGVKALLCLWFIAMTSPTAAHAIARAAHKAGFPLWKGSVVDRYAGSKEDPKGVAS
ncbi:MAG: monovalent cation/H(+) antiporter subunit G [Planctomycetota bacterium]|nr:monovalent cation/H(+) antiporter subunit G [Planctomycetota bacterium]